ncbi:MAG: AAA family ATPase [Bacteroidales bacterium]|jgi:AAA15 family ATPase/GTPase|nr:AAA family ATPase [Bacteroidales bacterium]
MLNSLHINNYRNLQDLTVNSLSRVNLITGKNNTGKSTILEAIAIYATKGDLGLIYQLLEERGENYKSKELSKNPTDINIKIFSSLFTNRNVGFDTVDAILIGNTENILPEGNISLRFIRYIDKTETDSDGNMIRRRTVIQNNSEKQSEHYNVGFEIKTGNIPYILPLDEDRPYRYYSKRTGSNSNLQFIRTRNIDRGINGNLFDNITLTEKEKYVIEALKIIEPLTERIAFVEEIPNERIAVIKLSNSQRILPLRSMGDGINRILTIILALVNADNDFLLVDEFENGLHYTVQEQLWNIIFKLAHRLNTQVFVTTHSDDCIRGFEKALNCPDNFLEGQLIRLDNENGKIKQVEFNAKELSIANDQNIEIR